MAKIKKEIKEVFLDGIEDEIDFERDALLDTTALDFEWHQQPSLAAKYAKYLVYCNSKVRKAEEVVR